MAGGRNGSTYSRFACYGAENEAAAISPSPKSLTTNHGSIGTYSRFASYGANTGATTSRTSSACPLGPQRKLWLLQQVCLLRCRRPSRYRQHLPDELPC